MDVALPLKEMSLADKIRTMEMLWVDLSEKESGFKPPVWHGEILEKRQAEYAAGKAVALDWEDAVQQIDDAVS